MFKKWIFIPCISPSYANNKMRHYYGFELKIAVIGHTYGFYYR